MLYEVPAIGRRPSEIDRLDKTGVMFPVVTQSLLRELVCSEASWRGKLGQLRLFFEGQTNFHS